MMIMKITDAKTSAGVIGQKPEIQPTDSVSKSIQNEISNVQRQKQGLSSNEELSAEVKAKMRQELQQKISSLNAQLRQRQADMRKDQKREDLIEELRDDKTAKDTRQSRDTRDTKNTESTDNTKSTKGTGDTRGTRQTGQTEAQKNEKTSENRTGESIGEEPDTTEHEPKTDAEKIDAEMSYSQAQAILLGESAIQQAAHQGKVVASMENNIVVLKGEIRQDEARGVNVEKKQAELAKQERRVQQASENKFTPHLTAADNPRIVEDAAFQFRISGIG